MNFKQFSGGAGATERRRPNPLEQHLPDLQALLAGSAAFPARRVGGSVSCLTAKSAILPADAADVISAGPGKPMLDGSRDVDQGPTGSWPHDGLGPAAARHFSEILWIPGIFCAEPELASFLLKM